MKGQLVLQIITETSDHDGYCSGEDCEYDRETNLETIEKSLSRQEIDKSPILRNLTAYETVTDENTLTSLSHEFFSGELEKLKREAVDRVCVSGGSYYCGLSEECYSRGLEKHDCLVTYRLLEFSTSPSDREKL